MWAQNTTTVKFGGSDGNVNEDSWRNLDSRQNITGASNSFTAGDITITAKQTSSVEKPSEGYIQSNTNGNNKYPVVRKAKDSDYASLEISGANDNIEITEIKFLTNKNNDFESDVEASITTTKTGSNYERKYTYTAVPNRTVVLSNKNTSIAHNLFWITVTYKTKSETDFKYQTSGNTLTFTAQGTTNDGAAMGGTSVRVPGAKLTFGASGDDSWKVEDNTSGGRGFKTVYAEANSLDARTTGIPTTGAFYVIQPKTFGQIAISTYWYDGHTFRIVKSDGTDLTTISGNNSPSTECRDIDALLRPDDTYYFYDSGKGNTNYATLLHAFTYTPKFVLNNEVIDELTLTRGQLLTEYPAMIPSGADYDSMTFASSNTSVAEVGTDGVVNTKAAGTTTITGTVRFSDGTSATASYNLTINEIATDYTGGKQWIFNTAWGDGLTQANLADDTAGQWDSNGGLKKNINNVELTKSGTALTVAKGLIFTSKKGNNNLQLNVDKSLRVSSNTTITIPNVPAGKCIKFLVSSTSSSDARGLKATSENIEGYGNETYNNYLYDAEGNPVEKTKGYRGQTPMGTIEEGWVAFNVETAGDCSFVPDGIYIYQIVIQDKLVPFMKFEHPVVQGGQTPNDDEKTINSPNTLTILPAEYVTTYSSDDDDVATVDASGNVTIHHYGVASIFASGTEQTINGKTYEAAELSYEFVITDPNVFMFKENETPAVGDIITADDNAANYLPTSYPGVEGTTANKTFQRDGELVGIEGVNVIMGGWKYGENFNHKWKAGDTEVEDKWKGAHFDPVGRGGKLTDGMKFSSSANSNARNEDGYIGGAYGRFNLSEASPFKQPCRGGYIEIDPLKNGTISVYIQQNGCMNYTEDASGHQTVPATNGFSWRPLMITDEMGTPLPKSDITAITRGKATLQKTDSRINWNLSSTHESIIKSIWPDDINQRLGVGYDAETGGWVLSDESYVKYTFKVKAGKTYFIYNNGSKMGFAGFYFNADAEQPTETLILNDATDYAPEAKSYAKVTLNRKFPAKTWTGLTLPFSMSERQVRQAFGADTQIIFFNSIEDNSETTKKVNFFNHVYNQMVYAGVPCLIYPGDDTAANGLTINSAVTVEPDYSINNAGSGGDDDLTWQGIYNGETMTPYSHFYNGKLYYVTKEKDIKGFRAYFKASQQMGAKTLSASVFNYNETLDDGNTTTAIEALLNEGEQANATANGVWSLSGVKMQGSQLSKGVYIVNGKKLVVK